MQRIEHQLSQRAAQLQAERLGELRAGLDRQFATLMIAQWIAAIVAALTISPRTWIGSQSSTHLHVWAAVLLGGVLVAMPLALSRLRPGACCTRHVIATVQMLFGAMLIHLSGGRIETHFHVFGSLAFLAFYRDWTVLLTATAVVGLDHFVRGVWMPLSVFGVLTAGSWRWLEHVGWVFFEVFFLMRSCRSGIAEMRSLAAKQAELEAARDLTERKVVERTEQMRAAMELASAASRAKSAFLANMSHEIRTPMSAILGYAELLLDDGDLSRAPERRVHAIRTIQRNGEHLLGVINDILDISKIEAGKLTIELSQCSPGRVLAEVASLMQVRAFDRGISFRVEPDGLLPVTVRSDALRLRQILVNLAGNAIKFTEQGGVLVVPRLIAQGDPRLQIDICDTGIGMSAEQAANLFQPFSQGDSSMARRFGGTGLGLMISQRLAEMLGGRIEIVSTAPGEGTTMRVTIATGPLDDVPLEDYAVLARNLESELSRPGVDATDDDETKPPLAELRVLLAEDGIDNQKLISRILTRAGAAVDLAENGRAAVDLAWTAVEHESPYDVILMDMQMPVMDGYEASALLRTTGYRHPIVALTAHAMSGEMQKCISAGCDGYLTKPIARQTLIDGVLRYVGFQRGGKASEPLADALSTDVERFRPRIGSPAALHSVCSEGE